MVADGLLLVARGIFRLGTLGLQALIFVWFLYAAYEIRLYPVKDFGHVIHEFDPWFNYRATEYLAEHGLAKFFKWYDYESWYPIGRPIGTTIYPGMQMTAVAIWETMKAIPPFESTVAPAIVQSTNFFLKGCTALGMPFMPAVPGTISFAPMSVNDICCMMPAWFGSFASLFTGLLAHEISRSAWAGVATAGIMAIIPAGLMRSMAGEFDNEAVAMTAICMTFWLWLRSVRTPGSWPWGFLVGASYAYMVAVWGGYIFVLNMIGVHALMLVGLGRFNSGVHKAYTLFFVIGTLGAVQIPVVGLQPLRSLEQLGPLLVFLGYQVLEFCDISRRRKSMTTKQFVLYRVKVSVVFLLVLAGIGVVLWPTGYFGPLSARIRGLFVKHTKTGNPLVDSVAEHQPANPQMYSSYLNLPLDYAVLGGAVCLWNRTNGFYFLMLYAFIATHFSGKMSRLVLICAPIVAVSCGIWCGFILDFITEPFLLLLGKKGYAEPGKSSGQKDKAKAGKDKGGKDGKDGKDVKAKAQPKKKPASAKAPAMEITLGEWDADIRPGGMAQIKRELKHVFYSLVSDEMKENYTGIRTRYDSKEFAIGRCCLAMLLLAYLLFGSGVRGKIDTFVKHCDQVARSLSNPQVVYKVKLQDGRDMLVDDYLRGYEWIDQNTPKDARVMAWWDYGYQITGIAKRTSIADGNTWNHEHIATLGRTLTSPEKKAWNAIRHLADYVLVWAGGGGDDLAKSPHLARIGNSVFPDHCGDDDPRCNKFSFYRDNSPTPMMAKSLLYKLVQYKMKPSVKLNQNLFQEVHTTKYGLMRVYKVMNISQESKDWVADPANRICDAPGSWYCVGQYPPALAKLIEKRRNFAQVEDFNKGGDKSAYTKLIEKELSGGGKNADL